MSTPEPPISTHFIRNIILDDLKAGRAETVITPSEKPPFDVHGFRFDSPQHRWTARLSYQALNPSKGVLA